MAMTMRIPHAASPASTAFRRGFVAALPFIVSNGLAGIVMGVAYLLGAGIPMAIGWVGGTALGHALPLTPRGPLAVAAAFLPLAFIVALLPTQWRGRRSLLPWTVAAAVAIGVTATLGPSWAMLIGGAAGTVISALRGDDA